MTDTIVAFFANPSVKYIVILIAIDVILGIIAAFLKKDFLLGKVAAFAKRGFINYVLGFVIVEIVAEAIPSLKMIVPVAYWLILLALIGSILDNLAKMGMKVPKMLTK